MSLISAIEGSSPSLHDQVAGTRGGDSPGISHLEWIVSLELTTRHNKRPMANYVSVSDLLHYFR